MLQCAGSGHKLESYRFRQKIFVNNLLNHARTINQIEYENKKHRHGHGILYNSSASKNRQYTGFHKMSVIFSLFCMTFHIIIALYYEKNANKAKNNAFAVETLKKIGIHTIILMISTCPSTIWDKSSASFAHTLT